MVITMNLNIEIINVNHPIFQSELVTWMSQLTRLNAKEKWKLEQIYRRILSLIDNPDDFISENLRIFINGQPFSCDVVKIFDFKRLMQELDAYPPITVGQKRSETSVKSVVDESDRSSSLVKNLKILTQSNTPSFFYYTVPVSLEDLLREEDNHFVIAENLLPFLRFLDLSSVDFQNVDLRGVDLSYTNISKIAFTLIYQNSLENTNLEGVNLAGQELKNVCADGANLIGTGLLIDLDSVSLEKTKFDGSVLLWKNGKSVVNVRRRQPIDLSLIHI